MSSSTTHTGALEERVADLERELARTRAHSQQLEQLAHATHAGLDTATNSLRHVVGLLIGAGNAVSLASEEPDALTRAQLLDTAVASIRAARDLLGGSPPAPRAVPPGGAA